MPCPHMTFPALDALPACRAAFLLRCPETDVRADKDEVLKRLEKSHEATRSSLGFGHLPLQTAEQVHGSGVYHVESAAGPIPEADSLITASARLCLGIYVADCAAVYVVDPQRRAIGLAHSGKKGTELGIVPATIEAMQKTFGSNPADMVIQVAPCIRPPNYEIDFAAAILGQARDCGVSRIFDCGENTAGDLERYYSYRQEKGKTGRMLALLALRN